MVVDPEYGVMLARRMSPTTGATSWLSRIAEPVASNRTPELGVIVLQIRAVQQLAPIAASA